MMYCLVTPLCVFRWLLLESVKFGDEVAVGLGMARSVAICVAQHVFRQEILRVRSGAGTHAEHDHRRAAGNQFTHPVRHDL